jgi:hypothetical protein
LRYITIIEPLRDPDERIGQDTVGGAAIDSTRS